MISLRVWNWLADLAQRERRIQYTNAAVLARINELVERTARSIVRSDALIVLQWRPVTAYMVGL